MLRYKDFDKDPIQNVLIKTEIWPGSVITYSTLKSTGVDFERGGYDGASLDFLAKPKVTLNNTFGFY